MTSRGPYRRHSTPFKLQLCQDIRAGIIGRRDAQRSHNISANLIQLWLTQFDRGELTDEEATSILGQIEKASGRSVEATRKVDPALIGGIVLQAGSLRVDASVRGRIEGLRRDLVRES